MQKTDDVDFDLSKGGEHARDVQTRHTAFLKKRCNPDAASATFRPRKRNRQSVVKALRLWDNQIRASTDTQGLVYFSFDEKSLADPSKWMDEPSISAATDMVETWCPLHMRACTIHQCRHSSALLHPQPIIIIIISIIITTIIKSVYH